MVWVVSAWWSTHLGHELLPIRYLSSIDVYVARHDSNKISRGCPTKSTGTPNRSESNGLS